MSKRRRFKASLFDTVGELDAVYAGTLEDLSAELARYLVRADCWLREGDTITISREIPKGRR